jgi:hypothetical protein
MIYIQVYLPWIMSCITIYQVFLAGNKSKHAWLIGLGNQVLWSSWIISMGAWGLLPMNIALWIVYTRNHLKWNKHEKPSLDWRWISFKLWKLLDDIDSFDDVFKDSDMEFRNATYEKQRQRFDFLPPEEIDKLYDNFYYGNRDYTPIHKNKAD